MVIRKDLYSGYDYHNKMKKYKCKKCGYKWWSRIITIPKECPNCKSRKWNNNDK